MDLSIINKFFVDEVYLRLLLVTVSLFVISLFTWFMYTRLSKRDLFRIESPGKRISWSDKAAYILKYIFFFPLFTFGWYLVFVACLRLLTQTFSMEEIMFLGIVLISAIRISAYVSERMAEDLAKLLPLALIVLIIIDYGQIKFASLSQLMIFNDGETLLTLSKYLFFTISLEFVLRTYYLSAIKSKQPSKRTAAQEEAA